MSANFGSVLHFLVPLALCLAGFHGVFFYSNLVKKAAAWCVFQMGWVVFLLLTASTENAKVLAFVVSAVLAVVGALLFAFCLKIRRRYKTLDGAEIAGRNSR